MTRLNELKQLARWVSILAHPFIMVSLLVAVPTLRQSSVSAVRSGFIVVMALVIPVALLMFYQVWRGRWADVDASKPSERPLLFVVALGSLVAALCWPLLNDRQSFLVRGMLVAVAFLCAAALLTRWVKLSLHVSFASLTATTLSLLGSPVGFALIAVVPVLWWSRIALGRHRGHELFVGLVLGFFTGVVLVRG